MANTENIDELVSAAKPKARLAPVDLDAVCALLGLMPLFKSMNMYGGECPICHAARSFFVWLEHNPVRVICYGCGLDLNIVRNKDRRGKESCGRERALAESGIGGRG